MHRFLPRLFRSESASGVLIVVAMILALIAENSPFDYLYNELLQTKMTVQVGRFLIDKPILLWINDALMVLFFLFVGLELKREILIGRLSSREQIVLPAVAAAGGIVVPALVYVLFNYNDATAMKGWAIPAATDIAFALGVLALVGSRVPPTLKLFLLALAIIDDIAAIVIIAVFYSNDLSLGSLAIAGAMLALLGLLNFRNVSSITPYIVIGVVLWVAVLKSGVHATLAGVLLALFIPLRGAGDVDDSPLIRLEHDLRTAVAFIVLPVFAFANAGISLRGVSVSALVEPVTLGIALGLFIGKQIGVFATTWVTVAAGLGRLPQGLAWRHVYGASVLCGIGFTMSLFISSLAFEQGGLVYAASDRLGILVGSLLSAVLGYAVLRFTSIAKAKELSS